MPMKKIRDNVRRVAAEVKKRRAAKSQPQWDELEQWCQQTTAKLASMDKKLTAILAGMTPCNNVSPELETAINKNAGLASHVDRQVPDERKK